MDDEEDELAGLDTLHMYGEDPDPAIPTLRRSTRKRNGKTTSDSMTTLSAEENEDIQDILAIETEYSIVVLVMTTVLLFVALLGLWKVGICVYQRCCCCKKVVRARDLQEVQPFQQFRRRDYLSPQGQRSPRREYSSSNLPLPPFPSEVDGGMEEVELFSQELPLPRPPRSRKSD